MAFSVQYHTDPQKFMAQNEAVLLKHEAVNNQMLGFLSNASNNTPDPFFLMATVKLNQKPLGCALIPQEGQPLILTPLPNNAAMHLANELAQQNIPLSGINGTQKTANTFVDAWCKATGNSHHLAINLGLFTAKKCPDPNTFGAGDGVIAQEKHRQTLTEFCHGYIEACYPDETDKTGKAEQLANMHIKQQTALLWVNEAGESVSVAVKQRETPNMAGISLVYTPPQHRGQNYGKCVVAALTNKLLTLGYKKCVLFANLNTPFTADFYRKIGYHQIETMPKYDFNNIYL